MPRRKQDEPEPVIQLTEVEIKQLKQDYEHLMGGEGWSRIMVEMPKLREQDSSGEYRSFVDKIVARRKLRGDKLTVGTWDGSNLVSSQCTDGFHRLVLDVDMEARVEWTEWGKSVLITHKPDGKFKAYSYFSGEEQEFTVPGADEVVLLDGTAWALPSSHKGHFHVYSNAPYTWGEYRELLNKLQKKKIIDQRYYWYSVERGFTAVRKPWVRKLGK